MDVIAHYIIVAIVVLLAHWRSNADSDNSLPTHSIDAVAGGMLSVILVHCRTIYLGGCEQL